jgi:radical SAM superfamily enzyme YgiQ (UPF0313 family)
MARILLAKARFTTLDNGAIVPPLGVMYIASVLREAGHHVSIYESGFEWSNLDRFRRALLDYRPDVVGLSAITFEAQILEAMAATARTTLPGVPIIVGGPHPTAYPTRCAEDPNIDFVVLGEGEETAVELVNALTRGGKDPRTVPGVLSRGEDGQLVRGPERELIEDVDAIPFPAWDLIDVPFYEKYSSMAHVGRRPYMLLFTSRGCPYRCTYCHEVQGKSFRARSPENVLREIREIHSRYGIRDFEIVDDIFNFDRHRLREILQRIIASPTSFHLHFPNGLRTDLLDEEQLRLLYQAGTQHLSIAVESVSPRLQRLTKKFLRLHRVYKNIELAERIGMFTCGLFMLGLPTETYEEARATVDFAVQSRLHQAFFSIATPFEGTEMAEAHRRDMEERGIEVDPLDLDYFRGNVNISAMSNDELFGLHREAYRRFYTDPGRVLRVFARHPRPQYLLGLGMKALVKALPRPRGNVKPELDFAPNHSKPAPRAAAVSAPPIFDERPTQQARAGA